MKEYTPESPVFSDKINIVETTDPVHADYTNAAPKQLLANDLALKKDVDVLKGTLEDHTFIYDKANHKMLVVEGATSAEELDESSDLTDQQVTEIVDGSKAEGTEA